MCSFPWDWGCIWTSFRHVVKINIENNWTYIRFASQANLIKAKTPFKEYFQAYVFVFYDIDGSIFIHVLRFTALWVFWAWLRRKTSSFHESLLRSTVDNMNLVHWMPGWVDVTNVCSANQPKGQCTTFRLWYYSSVHSGVLSKTKSNLSSLCFLHVFTITLRCTKAIKNKYKVYSKSAKYWRVSTNEPYKWY